ncbi:DUF4062 domain-containing protein [Mycobacterium simiae]|uniref:DUF4062 domain-containing protein n=1 Tax=Mycobacterium simiae TaxID=1784 RepID=UPI0026032E2A|nr:DUF4062 domain-containing protein [Mycobacterium simiae]
MVDKRYQVFVSSTYKDLSAERAAVIQAILNLEHFPAGMELFPAANDDQWTLITQVIDQSDYYVVVVAGRYGSVSATGVSYTEREYDYAAEIGVPILGFVHGEPDKIEVGKAESTAAARRKLSDFRNKVESRLVKYFTSPAELGGHVTTSLVREIRNSPRTGWVPGDRAMTAETERELLKLRAELAEAREKQSQIVKSTQAAIGRSDLAQEDDKVEIPLRIYSRYSNVNTSIWARSTVTWNDILTAIGPPMIDEATEAEIEEKLELCLYFGEMPPKHREVADSIKGTRLSVSDESLETVLVHFRLLGIIESGTKKRTPSDTNRYLRLTPLGVEKLAALKAVVRKDDSAKAPAKKATANAPPAKKAAVKAPVKKAAAKKQPAKKAK